MALFKGGKMLAKINKDSPNLGALLSALIETTNKGFKQAGIGTVGQAVAPPPPQAVDATVIGEQLHLRITDNNPTNRSRKYWAEVATDQAMSQQKVVHPFDASRSPAAITLPTYNNDGVMQMYWAHVYSQDPGSPPSKPTQYPLGITMNGISGDPMTGNQGDLPASTGSGTASTVTPSPAQGYGTFPTRKATSTKRSV